MPAHTICRRLTTTAAVIGLTSVLGTSVAHAGTASVTATSNASTQRALSLTGLGLNLSVSKVSNPHVVVTASANPLTPGVSQTIHAAPTPTCAAGDDPAAGYLNRTIVVTVAAGSTATVHTRIDYDQTDAAGNVKHFTVEPFGANGITMSNLPGIAPMSFPFELCTS
jgi:hypothetical protein